MSNDSTLKIQSALKICKDRIKDAENKFSMEKRSIERSASGTMNLFGSDTLSRVADISTKTRMACDDLYTAYQASVISLDQTCRPLLDEDTEPSIIKEVADFIQYMNKESAIESNYSASLNGENLGDVAATRYVPSLECKVIEHFWTDKYSSLPSVIEAEKEKAEQAEKSFERLQTLYKEEYAAYEAECERIKTSREELYEKLLCEETEKVNKEKDEAEKKYASKIDSLNKQLNETEEELATASKTLESLGFFAFKKKSELKHTIQDLTEAAKKLVSKIDSEKKSYSGKIFEYERNLEEFKITLHNDVENKLPFPEEPKPPRNPANIRDASEIDDSELSDMIIKILKSECTRSFCVSEIVELLEDNDIEGLTHTRIASIIRPLYMNDMVYREEKNRKAYFRIAY